MLLNLVKKSVLHFLYHFVFTVLLYVQSALVRVLSIDHV